MFATLYFISEWAIRLVMLPIVLARKRPPATVSWLAVIFFLPWVGLFFYLLIGEHRLGRRRSREHARAMHLIRKLTDTAIEHAAQHPPRIRADRADLVRLTQSLAEMPAVGGNDAELVDEPDEFIKGLIADIDGASRSVHLLFYIYADDRTGRLVADALKRAAARGVECRVLADAVGSPSLFKGLHSELRAAGVLVEAALQVNPLRRRLHRIDLRNHRKIGVIDGTIAWVGSQNIVNADYGGSKAGPWRDLMVRLVGPVAVQCEVVFYEDWYFATGKLLPKDSELVDPESAGEATVQTVPSGPVYDSDVFLNFVVGVIHEAEHHVVITSPYFVPDPAVLLAMKIVVGRGIRVDVVLPKTSNHPLICAAAQAHFAPLLEAGVHIHLHQQGLLHAKTIRVDNDIAIIGSGNFDMRSFYLNFEFNLVLYGQKPTNALRRIHETYIAQSTPLALADWCRRPRWKNAIDNAAGLLSPLL